MKKNEPSLKKMIVYAAAPLVVLTIGGLIDNYKNSKMIYDKIKMDYEIQRNERQFEKLNADSEIYYA